MSREDDQRAAPTETQRLRSRIEDLTRERDLYKRMLERYEPDPTYSTPTELDRLRAELAETRAAGDALADAKNWVQHVVKAEQWRSLRGSVPAPDRAGDDEPRPPSPDPRGDGLCPNCPTDLGRTKAGHGVCIECGWTSDPGKCFELYNRIDELSAEVDQLRAGGGVTAREDEPSSVEVLRRYLADPNRYDHPTDDELGRVLAELDRLRQGTPGEPVLTDAVRGLARRLHHARVYARTALEVSGRRWAKVVDDVRAEGPDVVVLERDHVDGGWVAEVPAHPGLVAQGDSRAEAVAAIQDVLAAVPSVDTLGGGVTAGQDEPQRFRARVVEALGFDEDWQGDDEQVIADIGERVAQVDHCLTRHAAPAVDTAAPDRDAMELNALAAAVSNLSVHLGMVADTDEKRRAYHVARVEALRDIETRLRALAAGSVSPDQDGDSCRSCGRPFSPTHDADAPGPTTRHPFIPAGDT